MENAEEEKFVGPTIERLRRAGQDVEEFVTESGRRTFWLKDGSILDKLFSRNVLTGDQYNAGIRFWTDWEKSKVDNVHALDMARIRVDGGRFEVISDSSLDAQTRWKRAVKAIGAQHYRAVCWLVQYDMDPVEYGRRFHKFQDRKDAGLAARVSLINALTELDLYYYGRKSTRMGAAHAEDYRPAIMPAEEGETAD